MFYLHIAKATEKNWTFTLHVYLDCGECAQARQADAYKQNTLIYTHKCAIFKITSLLFSHRWEEFKKKSLNNKK